MALYPVQILLAYQVDAGLTKSFELEEQVLTSAKAIFNPVLYLINRSTGLVHFKVDWLLDAGMGNDPLYSGTFLQTVVDADVTAGDPLPYDFQGNNLNIYTDPVASRHSVYIENKSASTQIYWVLLVGRAEIQMQLPANEAIIKE
jgi:hypothetical protein